MRENKAKIKRIAFPALFLPESSFFPQAYELSGVRTAVSDNFSS